MFLSQLSGPLNAQALSASPQRKGLKLRRARTKRTNSVSKPFN